ncbi:MAG: hypothetical protein U0936_22515 [Planctomycetaceae bacterium]
MQSSTAFDDYDLAVPQAVISSDAFQETPMVRFIEPSPNIITPITNIRDVARIVEVVLYRFNGTSWPVLIDVPKTSSWIPFRSAKLTSILH